MTRSTFTTLYSVEIMGPAPVRYDVGGVALSAQRARVREHLDALVERGLATRVVLPAVGRGRPAGSYAPATSRPEPDPRVRDYAGLATALAGQIARTLSLIHISE